jgi:ubiquinone/menaquinone biosynthesis C-methylase UbiE
MQMDDRQRYSQWESGEGYNRYITAELKSFRKIAWKRQILQHFDARDWIKVLDVGTGPGFFACILSEEGLEVTAIDQSEGMLEKARENARKLDVSPSFLRMNVNQLDFPDETFDVIVSRNVTWTLQYPEKVYAEFKRVLKPGGTLLIYDANWHAHLYDPELMEKVRAREEAHFRKYGTREIVTEDNPEFLATCPMTRNQRPEWDERVLSDLGMTVEIQRDIGRFVYGDWEKELYAESPLFEICAKKVK